MRIVVAQSRSLGHLTYGSLFQQALERADDVDLDFQWITEPKPGNVRSLTSLWVSGKTRLRNLDQIYIRRELALSLRARRAVVKSGRDRRPDLLIFSPHSLAYLAPRSQRFGVVLDKTSRISERDWHPVSGSMTLNHRAERTLFKRASFIIAMSSGAGNSVVQDYDIPSSKVHVVAPGVDLDRITYNPNRSIGGPLRIIFIGGDFRRKGGPELLETVLRFEGRVELDVVTKQDRPSNLPPWVRWHTGIQVYTQHWNELLQAANILAVPSHLEPFGHVYMEAMAAGLPVIMGDTLAAQDLISAPGVGTVVRGGDVEELTKAVARYLADPDWTAANGRAARLHAIERFDASRNFRKVIDIAIAGSQ